MAVPQMIRPAEFYTVRAPWTRTVYGYECRWYPQVRILIHRPRAVRPAYVWLIRDTRDEVAVCGEEGTLDVAARIALDWWGRDSVCRATLQSRRTWYATMGLDGLEGGDWRMIRKVSGGYRVVGKTGRNMGTYKTKAAAEKRLAQVEMFKHIKAK